MGHTFKSGEVDTFARCKTRIKHKGIFAKKGTSRDWKYDRAKVVKSLITEALLEKKNGNEMSWDDIYERLSKEFSNLPFETIQTSKAQARENANTVVRYLQFEKKSLIGCNLPVKLYDLPGEDEDKISVKPDLIFESNEGFGGSKIIHVVKIGLSKKPSNFNKRFESKLFAWYAQEFIDENGIENVDEIQVSYYFLRKSDDNKKFSPIFGGSNIETTLRYDEKETSMNFLAPIDLSREIGEFTKGIEPGECTEQTCEYCDLLDVCKAKKIPVASEETSVSTKKLIKTLSPTQKKAVYIKDGIWRVNAVAGAGKTMVICLRTAVLLSQKVKPEDIILLTFTEKAAEEMKERVKAYAKGFGIEVDTSKLHCQTFHSYGNDIIANNYKDLGYAVAPRLIDTIEQKRIIASLLEENYIEGLDYKNFRMDMPYAKGALITTLNIIEMIKSKSLTLCDDDIDLIASNDVSKRIIVETQEQKREAIKKIFDLKVKYNNILKTLGLIDYIDQESVLIKLSKENPYVFEDLGFKHVIIDEFQDVNDVQFEIIKGLANNAVNKSLMVVGDDLQSIYAFRGSIPEYIVKFYDYLGLDGEDIDLSTNYRSSKDIIDFANSVIDKIEVKVDKKLQSNRGYEEPVEFKTFEKKDDEPLWIADKIEELIKAGEKKENICVIAYTGSELQRVGDQLSRKDIEWTMYNPEKYLDNIKVRGALSIAHLVKDINDTSAALCYLNAKADNDLLRLFDDNYINQEINNLIENIKQVVEHENIERMFVLFRDLGLDDEIYEAFYRKLDNHKSTFNGLIDYMMDFETYGENEKKKRDKKYPGVILTTAHSSKGLEFNIVFNSITSYVKKNTAGTDEEWRLFFTSVTRAKNKLFITSKEMQNKKDRYHFSDRVLECLRRSRT